MQVGVALLQLREEGVDGLAPCRDVLVALLYELHLVKDDKIYVQLYKIFHKRPSVRLLKLIVVEDGVEVAGHRGGSYCCTHYRVGKGVLDLAAPPWHGCFVADHKGVLAVSDPASKDARECLATANTAPVAEALTHGEYVGSPTLHKVGGRGCLIFSSWRAECPALGNGEILRATKLGRKTLSNELEVVSTTTP